MGNAERVPSRHRSPARCSCSRSGSSTRIGSACSPSSPCSRRSARRRSGSSSPGSGSGTASRPAAGWPVPRSRRRAWRLTVARSRRRRPALPRAPFAVLRPLRAVGGSPGGIVKNAFHRPARRARGAAFDERGLRYLAALLLPLAALSSLAPLALVIAAPEIAFNLLSSLTTQTSVEHHYAAGAMPGLIVAAIFGAARLSRAAARVAPAARRGRRRSRAAGARTRSAPCRSGAASRARAAGPPSSSPSPPTTTPHDACLRASPPVTAVSATNTLGAHLSDRRRVLSFPRSRRRGLGGRRPPPPDPARPGQPARRAAARWPRSSAIRRWRLVAADDGVLLFVGELSGSPAAAGTRRRATMSTAPCGPPRRRRATPARPGTRRRATASRAAATRASARRGRPRQPRAEPGNVPGDGNAAASSAAASSLGHAELGQPGRQREARLLAGLARDGFERAEPARAVAHRRERGDEPARGEARSRPAEPRPRPWPGSRRSGQRRSGTHLTTSRGPDRAGSCLRPVAAERERAGRPARPSTRRCGRRRRRAGRRPGSSPRRRPRTTVRGHARAAASVASSIARRRRDLEEPSRCVRELPYAPGDRLRRERERRAVDGGRLAPRRRRRAGRRDRRASPPERPRYGFRRGRPRCRPYIQ